jgi:succinyl-CoA synthetase beta subunit
MSPFWRVDIEAVAASTAELTFKEHMELSEGIKDSQSLWIANNLGFLGPLKNKVAGQVKHLLRWK